MMRHSHLVLESDRPDRAEWLTEMLDNGWKLTAVDQGLFYFENMDVIIAASVAAMNRDRDANGPTREMIDASLRDGIAAAGKLEQSE